METEAVRYLTQLSDLEIEPSLELLGAIEDSYFSTPLPSCFGPSKFPK